MTPQEALQACAALADDMAQSRGGARLAADELRDILATVTREQDVTLALETEAKIRRAVQCVLFNVSNYPRRAQPYLAGQNIAPLTSLVVMAVTDALGGYEDTAGNP